MTQVLIINGPNLNMLGQREPEIYGHQTLDDVRQLCTNTAADLGLRIDFRQSNHEGEIVTWIQEEIKNIDGVIINAAAYTHTSVAIHDALKLLECPIIEVHISDPKARETFRHHSYIEVLAHTVIVGKGVDGYVLALKKLREIL